MLIDRLEKSCEEFLRSLVNSDSAHDISHIKRVVTNAKAILKKESADPDIVVSAAWLHDCVVLPKDHPDRKRASNLAAEKALSFLSKTSFPNSKLDDVYHAIESHSFSAGIKPKTIEAKIVQDADRLDALGAIGIARCFMVGGVLNRQLYNSDDPFCDSRIPDDSVWNIDHFYTKLFKLPESMNTETGSEIANSRVSFMKVYLDQLGVEINS